MFRKGNRNEPDRQARRDRDSAYTINLAGLQSYLEAHSPGAIQGTSTRVDSLPTRGSADPIRGWKTYDLALFHGKWRLLGYGGSAEIPIEGPAKCMYVGDAHKPPVLDCTCGFYAFKEAGASRTMQVEVDLSGRIIVCEQGYRAEYQSILGVHFSDWCRVCGEAATTLVRSNFPGSDNWHGVDLTPVCARHSQGFFEIPLDTLSNSLGTEVRFGL